MQCMYNLRVPQGAPVRPSVTDLRIYGFTPLPPPPVATTRDAHLRIKTLPARGSRRCHPQSTRIILYLHA
jgi:hypothetical protein